MDLFVKQSQQDFFRQFQLQQQNNFTQPQINVDRLGSSTTLTRTIDDNMEIINDKDDVLHDEIIEQIETNPRMVDSLGYDLSVMTINDVHPILEDIKCRICMATVCNPVVVKHCLHFFCKECLEMSMRQL